MHISCLRSYHPLAPTNHKPQVSIPIRWRWNKFQRAQQDQLRKRGGVPYSPNLGGAKMGFERFSGLSGQVLAGVILKGFALIEDLSPAGIDELWYSLEDGSLLFESKKERKITLVISLLECFSVDSLSLSLQKWVSKRLRFPLTSHRAFDRPIYLSIHSQLISNQDVRATD